MTQSWKVEMIVDGVEGWQSNSLRFPTYEEADLYVLDLAFHWNALRKSNVVECDDPPNQGWDDENRQLIDLDGLPTRDWA